MGPRFYKGYYDVVILLPPAVRDEAIRLSRAVKRRTPASFVLGRRKFIPHISLYHVPIAARDFPTFRQVLERIISQSRLGTLAVQEIASRGGSSLWLGVTNPAWLKRLHRQVLNEIALLRNRRFNASRTWGGGYSERRRELIQRYGAPSVGRFFRPHITITSLRDDRDAPRVLKALRVRPQSFGVTSISVCELGSHHTCHRIVFTIRKP